MWIGGRSRRSEIAKLSDSAILVTYHVHAVEAEVRVAPSAFEVSFPSNQLPLNGVFSF